MLRPIFFILFFIKCNLGYSFCIDYKGSNINCLNQNKNKEGYWIHFIDNDTTLNKMAEGAYIDGARIGIWKFYGGGDAYGIQCEIEYLDSIIVIKGSTTIFIKNDFSLLKIEFGGGLPSTATCNKCGETDYYNCIYFNRRNKEYSNYTFKEMRSIFERYNLEYYYNMAIEDIQEWWR